MSEQKLVFQNRNDEVHQRAMYMQRMNKGEIPDALHHLKDISNELYALCVSGMHLDAKLRLNLDEFRVKLFSLERKFVTAKN